MGVRTDAVAIAHGSWSQRRTVATQTASGLDPLTPARVRRGSSRRVGADVDQGAREQDGRIRAAHYDRRVGAAARPRDRTRGARGCARDVRRPTKRHEQIVGDASHAFLPGLRAPVANDEQGVVRQSRSRTIRGCTIPNNYTRYRQAPMGDDDRPRALHRVLGVHDGVLRREQHPDGRRARGRARSCGPSRSQRDTGGAAIFCAAAR